MLTELGSARAPARRHTPPPPAGLHRVRWWGPGLLWAMAALGSGSVLFTPRVAAEYRYAFLWLMLGVAVLMWVMIREAGRFTVVTGRTLLDGYTQLPGPRNWALWALFLPQLVAAVTGIGGLAALVGSTLAVELPGGLLTWSLVTLLFTTTLVVAGGYTAVSRTALVFALVLVVVMIVAAVRVLDSPADPAQGLLPGIPDDTDVAFLLPWVGTILASSMGIIWYSYWAASRGYAGGITTEEEDREAGEQLTDEERLERLRGWFRTLSSTALIGVATGIVIMSAFMVLGAELLAPQDVVPEGADVAEQLTKLLSEVWGEVGHWLMVIAILATLGGAVLADQDGWSRSFADIVLLMNRPGSRSHPSDELGEHLPGWLRTVTDRRPDTMSARGALKLHFALFVAAIAPAVLIVVVRDPVQIMSAAGIIAAVHVPFIVFTMLATNRLLPESLRPSLISATLLVIAGLFYSGFAVLYVGTLVGLVG